MPGAPAGYLRSTEVGQPPFGIPLGTQSNHPQVWHLGLNRRDRFFVLELGAQCPGDDVVAADKEMPEWRLHVSCPERLAGASSCDGAADEAVQGHPDRVVQPEEGIRPVRQKAAGTAVLPLGHPGLARGKPGHIRKESGAWCPVRAVVQRVNFGIRNVQFRCNSQ